MPNKILDETTKWIVGIGAVNWGLTLFDFNAVTWLLNLVGLSQLATIIYAVVGIAGLYFLWQVFQGK